jgi:heptosyltransferase III
MRLMRKKRRSNVLTAAVIPALGIGDALLMMIASHQLKLGGYHVTTFHHHLPELSSWFPGHNLLPFPESDQTLQSFQSYDLILVENDNSAKIRGWIQAHRQCLSIFYPTYRVGKHAALGLLDQVFNSALPMADNIANAMASLIELEHPSKENGLTPPSSLIHRRRKEDVLLHPTSRSKVKNWKKEGFLQLAQKLREGGFHPIFCLAPSEMSDWNCVEKRGFTLASTPTLCDLAALTYESGFVIGNDSAIGHLASNLNIPTLIIANEEKRMHLWRPGWLQGELVLPPPYLPNWKFLRLKDNHWQSFVSPNKVLNSFNALARSL